LNRSAVGLVLAFVLGVAFTFTALSMMQSTWHVSSHASLKALGVEVYWNPDQTAPVTSINWGILEPGDTKNVTVYIVNTGNVPNTLSISTGNWQPAGAADFITLTWNYNGSFLAVAETRQVILSLHTSPNITGITTFSFDITITGSG